MRKYLFLILLFLPVQLLAETYPQARTSFVNDYAEILDEDAEARITEHLKAVRKDHGREFTVVTINSITDFQASGDVPAYATSLFNHWGVGDKDKNDGVLMLVSLRDREVFIALGDGYAPVYDDLMDEIFDQYMKQNFRDENYALGLEDGTAAVIQRITTRISDIKQKTAWQKFSAWLNEYFFFIIAGMVGVFLAARSWLVDKSYKLRRCPTCGTRGLSRHRKTLHAATRTEIGEREVRVTCSNCDYDRVDQIAIPIRTSSSSSGGGSFGGGSSSGGGGGGKW